MKRELYIRRMRQINIKRVRATYRYKATEIDIRRIRYRENTIHRYKENCIDMKKKMRDKSI